MDRPTLHLLMGLPGAGKSTLAGTLARLTDAKIVSSDETRLQLFEKPCFSQDEHDQLYALLDETVEKVLSNGDNAIYDANLNRKMHRDEKYQLAKKLGVAVRLWWVQTPKELAKDRRVTEQNHILIPDGETPERMFERIASVLEEPEAKETVTLVDGTRINDDYIKELL